MGAEIFIIQFEFQYGSCPSTGIIESILARRRLQTVLKLLLICLLTLKGPDHGIPEVFHRYGKLRYRYDLSSINTARTASIQMADILKPDMISLDPFWATKRYGVTMKFKDVP